jgi:Ca2+-binding EF-hand superfamily protein
MTCKPFAIVAGIALACAMAPAAAQTAAPAPATPKPSQAAPAAAGPDAMIDAMFKAWDADHNGVLSQAEFRKGWDSIRDRAEAKVETRLREQFDKVDANGNGAVDAGEYGKLLLVQRAGKSAPPLSTFDRNGDQRLDFDEYMTLISRLVATPRNAGQAP